MKKRVKIFESGNYTQGNFDVKRVNRIFSNINDKIKGIFIHSSKWKNENKAPLEVATFDNFDIKENNGIATVYADITLNDKGKSYYEDGTLKGVSVEIDGNDNLDKIAVLPIGTTPAINGAEFEIGTAIFNLKGDDYMTKEEILKSLTIEDIKNLEFENYEINIKEIKKEKPKTEEEIRKEILNELKTEFEEKERIDKEIREFEEKNKNKLTPAIKEILTENTMKAIFKNKNIEFDNTFVDISKIVVDLFDKIPNLIDTKKVDIEFEEKEKEKTVFEIMKEAKEKTEKMYK